MKKRKRKKLIFWIVGIIVFLVLIGIIYHLSVTQISLPFNSVPSEALTSEIPILGRIPT